MSQIRKLPFVLAATDIGSMIVHRQDVSVNDLGQGFGVGWDLVETADYEGDIGDFIAQVLDARRIDHGVGVLAIDCGANVGAFTLRWAKEMTGWGRILAFEMQERLFYCLAGNIALNNCLNARAVHAAVASTDGTVLCPVPDYNHHCSFGSISLQNLDPDGEEKIGQVIDYTEDKMVRIASVRIDSLYLPRCDFIKIDVEGMEVDVLDGAAETLARCQPIVMCEMLKCDKEGVVDRLDRAGYAMSPLGQSVKGKMNLLAIHNDDPTRRWVEVGSVIKR